MIHAGNKGFTRLETILGLVVVTAVLATAGPLLWRGSGQDRPRQAVHRAAEIAAAVLDYRAETGAWPAAAGAVLDVACLTEAPARRAPVTAAAASGTLVRGADAPARPWLAALPVDPWGRPYRAYRVPGGPAGGPQAVAVISAGPDGIFQTSATRAGSGPAGDDLGAVLAEPTEGGSRP